MEKNTLKTSTKINTLFAETEEQKKAEAIIEKIDEKKAKTIVKYPRIQKFNVCSNSYINSNGKVIKAYTLSVFPNMPDDFYNSIVGRYQRAEACIVGGLNNGYKGKFDAPFYVHTFNGVKCIAMKPSYTCENYNDALNFYLDFAETVLKLTEKNAVDFKEMEKIHAEARAKITKAKEDAEKEKRDNLKKDFANRFKFLQFETK